MYKTKKKMSLKLFVSGKYDDRSLIREKINELRELGHTITYDWTDEKNIAELQKNYTDKKQKSAVEANLDINGVKNCDCHIIIITDKTYAYRGTSTELGCSLGLGKCVYLYCPFKDASCMTCPFYNHPLVECFDSWTKLLEKISGKK
jgi:nucleoside 2-deoxyribosyltransferase